MLRKQQQKPKRNFLDIFAPACVCVCVYVCVCVSSAWQPDIFIPRATVRQIIEAK